MDEFPGCFSSFDDALLLPHKKNLYSRNYINEILYFRVLVLRSHQILEFLDSAMPQKGLQI